MHTVSSHSGARVKRANPESIRPVYRNREYWEYGFRTCPWAAIRNDGETAVVVSSFMEIALEEARAAAERGEVPVGCAIALGGEVIARAGNRTLAERDPTAHAELLAIREAARALNSERLVDCDLYVTLEPCTMCAAAIAFARIRRLYYGAADPKGGAVESGVRFFAGPTCHHRPEVYGGIRQRDAAALLRDFFAGRR
jgi:tRNA(adenine34) deaminase